MSLGDAIRRGALWLSAFKLLSRGLDFAFGVVLARLLVPGDFGLLVTIQVFTGIAGYFAGGGMGQALVRKKDIGKSDAYTCFTAQLVVCSLIYALFFWLAPWVAVGFQEPIYEDLMRVSALSFLLRAFGGVPRMLLYREMRFRATGILDTLGQIVSGTASITLALYGMGVWSLVLGGLAGATFTIIPAWWMARWLPRIRFDVQSARELASFGMKSTFNDLVDYVKTQVPNVLIGRLLGPGSLGLFNKADSLCRIPLEMISGSLYQPLFRGMAQLQDNADKSKYLYLRGVALAAVYGLPFYVGLWWLSDPFVTVVYGEKWRPAAEPLRILSTLGLLRIIGNQSGAVAAARNLLGREILIQIQAAMLMAAGVLWGMPHGLEGIAWGIVAAQTFLMLRIAHLAGSSLSSGLLDLVKAVWPAVLLNSLMLGVLYVADQCWKHAGYEETLAYLLTMSALGAAAYALFFLALPIKSLATETARWKQWLRIPQRYQESA